jgi:hypothetical protein
MARARTRPPSTSFTVAGRRYAVSHPYVVPRGDRTHVAAAAPDVRAVFEVILGANRRSLHFIDQQGRTSQLRLFYRQDRAGAWTHVVIVGGDRPARAWVDPWWRDARHAVEAWLRPPRQVLPDEPARQQQPSMPDAPVPQATSSNTEPPQAIVGDAYLDGQQVVVVDEIDDDDVAYFSGDSGTRTLEFRAFFPGKSYEHLGHSSMVIHRLMSALQALGVDPVPIVRGMPAAHGPGKSWHERVREGDAVFDSAPPKKSQRRGSKIPVE